MPECFEDKCWFCSQKSPAEMGRRPEDRSGHLRADQPRGTSQWAAFGEGTVSGKKAPGAWVLFTELYSNKRMHRAGCPDGESFKEAGAGAECNDSRFPSAVPRACTPGTGTQTVGKVFSM